MTYGFQHIGRKSVSIVVPCFNEAEVINPMLDRLGAVCDGLEGYDCEIILVDDGSKDATPALLKRAARRDPRVKVITFARNFGHQIAVSAGIDAATGDAVVLIDADLQDPPELIPDMIHLWREGYDVIYGQRAARKGESPFKTGTAHAFYRLLNKVSEVPIPLDTGDFRLMTRDVADVLRDMPERHRFLRGMVSWAGFNQTAILYQREGRVAGETKYPLRKMLRFASDAIMAFSTRPLQVASGVGLFVAGMALLGILYAIGMRIFTDIWVEGWTMLFIAVLFLGGVQLICLGILGEYIGRIYDQTKGRPLYVVRERIGFDRAAATEPHSKSIGA